MKPDSSRLRQQQQHVEQTELNVQPGQSAREFASVDDLIRFDASQHPPPEVLAERLKASTAREPKPVVSWWRRLLGKAG
jgi:hypothetical protein